jgi:hypothetical protein
MIRKGFVLAMVFALVPVVAGAVPSFAPQTVVSQACPVLLAACEGGGCIGSCDYAACTSCESDLNWCSLNCEDYVCSQATPDPYCRERCIAMWCLSCDTVCGNCDPGFPGGGD